MDVTIYIVGGLQPPNKWMFKICFGQNLATNLVVA